MSPMDRKMADDSQQPKASLTKLLMLLSETLSHWISERSYVLSDAEVYSFHCLASNHEDLTPVDRSISTVVWCCLSSHRGRRHGPQFLFCFT